MTSHYHNHQECIAFFERLSEYIDEETDEITCEAISAHMAECSCCTACFETLKRTVGLCEKVKEEPVPQKFSSKLRQALKDLLPHPH